MDATLIRNEMRSAVTRAFKVRGARDESMLAWGKRFFPKYFYNAFGSHHIKLDKKLRAWTRQRGVRAAIEGPRECAKSALLAFLYPMWSVCMGTEDYIMILADTNGQAVKHLKGIMHELEENVELAEAYPSACGRGSEWNNNGILTRNGIRIEPLGAGQKIRGRRKLHIRPTLIIIDDPEGDDAAYSAQIRTTTRDWALKGAFKAGSKRTNILVAGTVIHRDCLVSHCGRLPGWKKLGFKAIVNWPDRMDLWGEWENLLRGQPGRPEEAEKEAKAFYKANKTEMRKGAEVLWPEQEDLYTLMFMRASEGHTAFESEKQNNPIDPSKCEWEPELFEGEEMWFDEWPKQGQCRTMALDPSKGRTDKPGDYQAIVELQVGNDGILYFDADISRRGLKQMVEAFVDRATEFKPDVAVVEDVQFQELLIPEIEAVATKKRLLVPVEGIPTGGVNKLARMRRLGSFVSRRRIKFKKRSAGAALLRMQMMDIPTGDYDDGPDAAEMAVRRATLLLAAQDVRGNAVANPF